MDLVFRTLDPADTSAGTDALLRGWVQAVARGFHDGRVKPETEETWLRHFRADAAVLRGAWLPEGAYGAGPVPVATFASWGGELNTGAGLLPLHQISEVTVSPAHRRQGLLRRLMTEDLDAAVAAGRPVAALTVSEGSIYGRFGFGAATWAAQVEMDVTGRFALAGHAPVGRFEAVEPADLWPLPRHLFSRWHPTARGSVSRPDFYESISRGEWGPESQSPDDKLRGAVHLDETGEPDGYVLYRHEGWDQPRAVTVVDMLALTPQSQLSLWRFLADLDLCDRVKVRSEVEDPVTWALVEPHCRRVTRVFDHIWLRVLDVAAALSARPWFARDSLVVEVTDGLGHAEGRWRLATGPVPAGPGASRHRATVEPTTESADVRLDVSTLSSLYLGGVRVSTLVRAGQVQGTPEALARFAAVADGGPAPFSRTSF